MQTITILVTQGPDNKPFYQIIPSDGIEPQQGLEACWRGVSVFQNMIIEAEVARRIEERLAEMEPKEAEDEADH
jgi:hypothetical protein